MTTNINIDASAYVKKTDLPSNLTLYPTTTASDIAMYFKLVTEITDPDYDSPAVDVATGAITGSNQLISSLATSAGILTGNPGIFTVSTVGNIRRTSGSGEAEFYFEIYQRNASGTETLIATSNATSSVSNTTYEQFNASALFNNGTFLPTDRIVLKFYGSKVGGGSNPSYQFQFGGSEPVRTIVPVPASVLLDVPIQVGVTEVVGGTSGKVLSNNSGVVGDIAIDTTPTNGSTNLIDSNAVYDGLAAKQDTLQSGTNIKTVLGDSLLGNGDVTIDLDDLSNVDSTGKNTGDVLEWNAVSGKWEAATPSGGGGGTPAGSSGEIQFNNSGAFGADSALNWDNTNKRLGIGTATPVSTIEIAGYNQSIKLNAASNDRSAWLEATLDGTGNLYLFNGSNSNTLFLTGNGTSFINGGSFSIGATSAGARLDVRAQGALSTDIAFRVRNSADTANLFEVTGTSVFSRGAGNISTNCAFGETALDANTTGFWNTSLGFGACTTNTTGVQNTAIGYNALRVNLSGNTNTAVGAESLNSSTVSGQTAIGFRALYSATSGGDNTAIGVGSLNNLTTGTRNSVIGANALSSLNGSDNVAAGWFVGQRMTLGSSNVFLGMQSGYSISGGTALTSATSTILIGRDTRPSGNSQSNQIVIGHQAIGNGSNTATIGNSSVTNLYVGTTLNLYQQSSAGITTVSDLVTILQNVGLLS